MYDRPTRFILLHTLAKIPTKNPTSITALEKSNISSLVACSENVANLTLRFPWRQSVARFIIATTIRLTMLSSGPNCTRAAAKFTVGKGHQWPRLRVLAYYHRRQVCLPGFALQACQTQYQHVTDRQPSIDGEDRARAGKKVQKHYCSSVPRLTGWSTSKQEVWQYKQEVTDEIISNSWRCQRPYKSQQSRPVHVCPILT